jgi:predicted MFS family arabinose efflux permease
MQTGAVNVFMTLVTVYLMDRLGRRSLLLTGLVGMAISYGVVTGAPLSSGQ